MKNLLRLKKNPKTIGILRYEKKTSSKEEKYELYHSTSRHCLRHALMRSSQMAFHHPGIRNIKNISLFGHYLSPFCHSMSTLVRHSDSIQCLNNSLSISYQLAMSDTMQSTYYRKIINLRFIKLLSVIIASFSAFNVTSILDMTTCQENKPKVDDNL